MAVLRQGHFVTAAQLTELHNADHRDAWLLSSDVEMHLRVLLGRGAVVKADSDVRTRWAAAPPESIDDGVRVEVRTYLAEANPQRTLHAGWRVVRRDPGHAGRIVICPSVDREEAEACASALNEMVRARIARETRPARDRAILAEGEKLMRAARAVGLAKMVLVDRGIRWVSDLAARQDLRDAHAYLDTSGSWRVLTDAQMRRLGELVLDHGSSPPESIVEAWMSSEDAGTRISHQEAVALGLDPGPSSELGPGVGLAELREDGE